MRSKEHRSIELQSVREGGVGGSRQGKDQFGGGFQKQLRAVPLYLDGAPPFYLDALSRARERGL